MGNDNPPPLTVVSQARAVPVRLAPSGSSKLWGHDTGGALAVVEHPFPVGALVPPHLHTREDEYSIVTEGQIGFRSGDREAVLGAGGYITKPRGELHAMWNAAAPPHDRDHQPGRVRGLLPGGGRPGRRPATVDGAALAARYGLEFADAKWLPDVIARYGLDPPTP